MLDQTDHLKTGPPLMPMPIENIPQPGSQLGYELAIRFRRS